MALVDPFLFFWLLQESFPQQEGTVKIYNIQHFKRLQFSWVKILNLLTLHDNHQLAPLFPVLITPLHNELD